MTDREYDPDVELSEDFDRNLDDDRDVDLDDDAEVELPPPTIDPEERVEAEPDPDPALDSDRPAD